MKKFTIKVGYLVGCSAVQLSLIYSGYIQAVLLSPLIIFGMIGLDELLTRRNIK